MTEESDESKEVVGKVVSAYPQVVVTLFQNFPKMVKMEGESAENNFEYIGGLQNESNS